MCIATRLGHPVLGSLQRVVLPRWMSCSCGKDGHLQGADSHLNSKNTPHHPSTVRLQGLCFPQTFPDWWWSRSWSMQRRWFISDVCLAACPQGPCRAAARGTVCERVQLSRSSVQPQEEGRGTARGFLKVFFPSKQGTCSALCRRPSPCDLTSRVTDISYPDPSATQGKTKPLSSLPRFGVEKEKSQIVAFGRDSFAACPPHFRNIFEQTVQGQIIQSSAGRAGQERGVFPVNFSPERC